MSKQLNKWQTWVLFLPFIIGGFLMAFHLKFTMIDFLFVLNVFLTISYQTYLAFSFNNQPEGRSPVFKWNALIPLVFSFVYLIFSVVAVFSNATIHKESKPEGPIHMADYHLGGWIIFALLIHAFITFYFINPRFIAATIRQVPDMARREQLKSQFLIPVQRVVTVSIFVFVIVLAITILGDLVLFWKGKG